MAKESRAKSKIARAMAEYSEHKLHSGSKHGPIVKSKQQALAIGESEERKMKRKGKRRG